MKTTAAPDERHVLGEVAEMITTVLGDYAPDAVEIGPHSRFGDDLEMESIDLVTLAGLLADRYGPDANFAAYLASLELDEIIALTVGDLVAYLCRALRPGAGG
ncbi:acyl carrier protein [Streptomyces sp. NPDC058308]|uniref:acyl carrier protein n=1 Tax=Streptomyces sp. NPDC058308 TaxID=3346440 RepID=UPI0036EBD1C6